MSEKTKPGLSKLPLLPALHPGSQGLPRGMAFKRLSLQEVKLQRVSQGESLDFGVLNDHFHGCANATIGCLPLVLMTPRGYRETRGAQ